MKKLLLFFSLISTISYGQITISYSDYQANFAQGSVYLSYSTPLAKSPSISVFVGTASASPQTWNFSPYEYQYLARSVSVDPATTPLINEFPGSNVVLFEKGWNGKADTFYMWNYKKLQSDKFEILGISDSTSVTLLYDPPAIHATIPLTYGSTWIRERDSTFIMPDYYIISEDQVTVDAFGTLTLPSGEYNCLRLTQLHTSVNHYPLGADTTRTKSYHFYSKEGIEVNLPSILEDQFELSTINVSAIKYSKREGHVGIQYHDSQASFVSIEKVFPNPFTEKTAIRFNVKNSGLTVLKVYDFLGREVRTLICEEIASGNHLEIFDASGLTEGMYYIQLQMNGITDTQKCILGK